MHAMFHQYRFHLHRVLEDLAQTTKYHKSNKQELAANVESTIDFTPSTSQSARADENAQLSPF